ncbi:MAG: choice-of-anchor X domain-containing protein, partial [Methanosarcinales archaeon]|nr:choice-of-anchor X domain-containing protein [Methanosarcinales archaeon]
MVLTLFVFSNWIAIAMAAGTPDKLIVFSDKKIYTDWYSDGRQDPNIPVFLGDNTPAQTPYLYAIVLDDDGNMMTGQTVSATIVDIARLDHADKADDIIHHSRTNTGGIYYDITVTLYDDGTNGDKNVGDGIYTYQWTPASRVGSTLNDDHLLINITATSGSLSTAETIMFTWLNCHKGDQDPHPSTHSLAEGAPALDGCTQCHIGFGHLYEEKSNDIDELGKDVHLGRMNPIVPSMGGKGNPNFEWNLSGQQSPNGYGTTAWDVVFPGAQYCYWCHYNTNGGSILDYGANRGARSDITARPSCSQSSVTLSLGTVTCHATTEMEASSVPAWSPGAPGGTVAGDPINNIIDGESHNHSSATQGAACATCHGSTHSLALPNMAVDISSTGDINNQCTFCHTSDGPSGAPHSASTTNCKSCHSDGSAKLDSHLVPVGKSGGPNCISCHDLGGIAGFDVDVTKMGSSAHSVLNSGATASVANNKKCYGCHGILAGGDADEADQPTDSHPSTYKTPRGCPDCHNNTNTGTNFSAPQVIEHTESAPTVPTTGTLCSVCHNNALTPSIGETDGFGLSVGGSPQNASTSHYLLDANANLMTTSIHSDDCRWCHITNNVSALWGTPFNPLGNPSHSTDVNTNDKCYSCHGGLTTGVVFHDPGITAGSSGGQDCVSCHEGTTGNKVHVASMNLSDSIHVNLNNLGTEVGRIENKMCYACHTNNSYIMSGKVDGSSIPVDDHPTGYTTPRNCTLCHINGNAGTNFNAPQVSEHYSSGTEIQTKSYINLNDSCISCHIENEMLKSFIDNNGTDYSNVSHYGESRNNTALVTGNVVNCSYCHKNASTFEFVDNTNRDVPDHSTNYPGTSPVCTDCHAEGRMHDDSLTIPALNDALCMGAGCHDTRQEHNAVVLCTDCHVDSGLSKNKAHPIQYIGSAGVFDTSNISTVNCGDCHQGTGVLGFESAPKVNLPINHSSDNAGQKWGNYWGASVGSFNNTNVIEQVVITGTASAISGAQTEDGSFETMTESNVGGASVNVYNYTSGNTQTDGTITNWANMQSGTDAGAFATLTEAANGGGAGGDTIYNALSSPTLHTNVIGAPDNTLNSINNLRITGSDFGSGGSGPITKVILKYYYSITSFNSGDVPSVGYTINAAETTTKTDTGDVAYNYPNPTYTIDITSDIGTWTWADVQSLNLWLNVARSGGPGTLANVDAFEVVVTTSAGPTTYSMNITTVTASVPAADTQYLEINYKVDAGDTYDIFVFDGSTSWNDRGDLTATSLTLFNYTLTANEYNSGTPSVRFIDKTPAGTSQGNLDIDYLRVHGVTAGGTNYRLDVLQNVTSIPTEDYYYLTVKGKTDGAGDLYAVQVYDSGTGWETKSTINSATNTWYNTSLLATQISGGKVQIRYLDSDISSDSTQSILSIDYVGVRSATGAAGISSCDYCHGDTRHNASALGKPANFQGSNVVGETDLTVSTWCLGCHLNGSANYGNMINALSPVPPEITNGDPNYPGENAVDHSGFTMISDDNCTGCHGSMISESANISEFMHNVAEGTSSNDCITCHVSATGPGGIYPGINTATFTQHRNINTSDG